MSTTVFGVGIKSGYQPKRLNPIAKAMLCLVICSVVAVGAVQLGTSYLTNVLTKNVAMQTSAGNLDVESKVVSATGMQMVSFRLTCTPGVGEDDTYNFTGNLFSSQFNGKFQFPSRWPFTCTPDVGSEDALAKLFDAIFKAIGGEGKAPAEQFILRRYVNMVVEVIKNHLTFIGY